MKLKKLFCVLASVVMLATSFSNLSITYSASAATEETISDIEDEDEDIKKLAEELEFLFDNAAITDTTGKIVDWDFDFIEETYGEIEYLDEIKEVYSNTSNQFEDVNYDSDVISGSVMTNQNSDTYTNCVIQGLANTRLSGYVSNLFAVRGVLSSYIVGRNWIAAAKVISSVLSAKISVPVMVGALTVSAASCI